MNNLSGFCVYSDMHVFANKHRCADIHGFTLIETVVVIMIIAVVSVFAIPRFFATESYDERGYYEQSLAAVRYAQKRSIASGCDTRVRFTAGTPGAYSIEAWAVCNPPNHTAGTTAIAQPDGTTFAATAPTSVSVSALDFYFDRIGQPREVSVAAGLITAASDLDLTIGSRTIQVQPLTGYIQ